MAQVMQAGAVIAQTLATNKVIRNTYLLLSLSLVWSAITAFAAIRSGVGVISPWLFLIFAIGMPMLIYAFRNSAAGLVLTFVYTGIFGFMLGPIVGYYIQLDPRIPTYALGTTALVFGGLSGYAMVTRKDFSFLRGFLVVGVLVVLAAIVGNIFLQMPALSMVISSAAILLASAGMLYSTSQMIHDGEANYIVIACSLFGDIWVMFMHLMRLFSFFMGED